MQLIGTAPYVLSTNPQKPFKTLGDVVATAKARPSRRRPRLQRSHRDFSMNADIPARQPSARTKLMRCSKQRCHSIVGAGK